MTFWTYCIPFVKQDSKLWALLASIAVQCSELNTAEVAYAALEDVTKVAFVRELKQLTSPELRNAELALFRKQLREAENILLNSGNIYSAIMLHIEMFNWDR